MPAATLTARRAAAETTGVWDDSQQLFREVFEGFPYGILVLDPEGSVVAHNEAARRLLGDLQDEAGPPATCCTLLGCRRPGGPLSNTCITALARQLLGTLPEVRVDVPGRPTPAVWVTASSMNGGSDRVLLQLRPGDPRDRRRRTEPHWIAGPRLRVRALGRTVVSSGEGPIGGEWLKQRPGLLLKYLVCRRTRAVYPDEIADVFWPEAGRRGLNNVRHFIHALRDRLEPERPTREPSTFVITRDGGYTLDLDRIDLDVDQFESLVRSGHARLAMGGHSSGLVELERAIELYEGDFLADEPYAEWALAERERLNAMAHGALRTLVDACQERGDLASAAHLDTLGQLDLFDAKVHRQIIEMSLQRGRHGEALRRYQSLRSRLLRSFGEEPDFTLAELGLSRG
jgi:DNA-binding SARP family transcriptional activator